MSYISMKTLIHTDFLFVSLQYDYI